MDVQAMSIEGAYVFTPRIHRDDRGSFLEWFKADVFEQTVGHPLTLAQANSSVSAAGTLRGIHFAELPPSQAKYVTCTRGAVWDVIVDIRVGSPTYGTWEAIELDDVSRRAVYLSEGLGHGFMALEDDSVVSYLCSAPYAPGREHGIHPMDETLSIEWPTVARDGGSLAPLLSPKDEAAPRLEDLRSSGVLANYDDTVAWRKQLAGGHHPGQ